MKLLVELISKEEVQEFIRSHEQADVQKLLLKHKMACGVPTQQIAHQIIGRRKIQVKLPRWYKTSGILYPPGINLEQCSSEATAQFKLGWLKGTYKEPPVIVDLSGGYGVDTYYLSQYAKHVHFVEPDRDLLEIVRHNHNLLGVANISYYNQSAESFLNSTKGTFDFFFVDPSRRKGSKKVFKLADCEPDVSGLQVNYFHAVKHILIKASPLLDLNQVRKELSGLITIMVVAVENECKELLFHIQTGYPGEPIIRAVDLNRHGSPASDITLGFEEEKKSVVKYSTPRSYIFEPNAAILKSGAFKWIAQKYGILKLAPNTHLYTAHQSMDKFPGRVFKILQHEKLDKNLKQLFANGYANILTRNYPLSVEEIKKKTELKEGGVHYLICAQGEKDKFVMIAERLK